MFNIRPYTLSDFDTIHSWWTAAKECPPVLGMMIPNGSFILELDSVPALSLTVFLTQSKEMAYIEGFIKNPLFKGVSLEEQGSALWQECFNYAKNRGYNRVLCLCQEPSLFSKYERFGMRKTANNLSSFVREL